MVWCVVASAVLPQLRLRKSSLIQSQLLYCSVLWRPQHKKDIEKLERIQRKATKFILNDYNTDYFTRLKTLNLLPLMYFFEMNDIMFAIRQLKEPKNHLNFVCFSSVSTRSSTQLKMTHIRSTNKTSRHFYFNRLPRLWNSLPHFSLDQPIYIIKRHLLDYLYNHFLTHFSVQNTCTYHFLCPCAKCSLSPPPTNFI